MHVSMDVLRLKVLRLFAGTMDFVAFAGMMREQLKLFCQRRMGNFIASAQIESGYSPS